jgi:hypothetical protein
MALVGTGVDLSSTNSSRTTRRSASASAFCLIADDADPSPTILTSAYDVRRPDGRLVLTGLNAGRLLATWHRGESTGQLDPMTLTEISVYDLPDGGTVELRAHYHPPDSLRRAWGSK